MEAGLEGYTLMTRAAEAALKALVQRWPGARRVCVICGAGNNGGDGLVLARLAAQAGLTVRVLLCADPPRLRGDAARAWQELQQQSPVAVECWSQASPPRAQFAASDVIVDGLFGIGLSRPLEGAYAAVVEAVNESARPVLALDVPSGLCSDRGAVMGCAIHADLTVTFIERKLGHYVGVAQDYVGDLRLARLGVEAVLAEEAPSPLARLLPRDLLAHVLAPRSPTAHKGRHGHVLVIGGDQGMAGAVRLAGEAALYAGAGLVTVATSPAHAPLVNIGRPELMCHGVASGQALAPLLARADVVVLGPGLGRGPWARDMLSSVLSQERALLLDADALNLLAEQRAVEAPWDHGRPVVLTPHPGEAGRLLGRDSASVQADRLGAHRALVERFGAVVVLKGAGTLVGAPGWMTHLCDRGNPGMAVAGMGDVLSGVIGALLAQGHAPFLAGAAGVLAHARAGDYAVDRVGGQRGLLAGEMAPIVREILNGRGEGG